MIRWCKVHHQRLTVLAFLASFLPLPLADVSSQHNSVELLKRDCDNKKRIFSHKYAFVFKYSSACTSCLWWSDAHVVSSWSVWAGPPDRKLIYVNISVTFNRLLIHPIETWIPQIWVSSLSKSVGRMKKWNSTLIPRSFRKQFQLHTNNEWTICGLIPNNKWGNPRYSNDSSTHKKRLASNNNDFC